jgi:CDP-diacylglycerol--glycerol-3-phosphate 3-phosphatidyltransferase
MNLPNKLTTIRILLAPVFFLLYYFGESSGTAGSPAFGLATAAFAIFVGASVTDAVDGHIARSRKLFTNYGKLMDPLADKVLTATAFICCVEWGFAPSWIVIVIIAREFLITGLRSVAASEGVVIAAGPAGKLKTVLQMTAISLHLLWRCVRDAAPAIGAGAAVPPAVLTSMFVIDILWKVCLWAALAVTIWSGAEYVWKCRNLLDLK